MTSPSRRSFVQMMTGAAALAAVGGCDPASDALSTWLDAEGEGPFAPPTADDIDPVVHVLNRLTWGPTPGAYARVQAMGVDAFIDEQLDPDGIDDRRCLRRLARLEPLFQPTGELYEYDPGELLDVLTRAKLVRGVHSRRQLYEVMVDFWTDHLNIVSEKGDCRWLKVADDRGVVREHALGRFRDLVRASATSPAMLIYLDGHDNKVEHPGDRPNENYARELLELHTLGVDGGYTQQDVMEVARCLSGWTYTNEPFAWRAAQVSFDPARHDQGEKIVLGHVIAAGGGGDDLERVLDIVCAHPSTARYIATRLCRRFIDDPAPPAAVDTVADAFGTSGGDIRTTLRALFATDAFAAARGTRFKRPLRYVLSALRAADARADGGPATQEALRRMGHAPFQYPTPDGYPLEAEPWMGTLLWRWRFALDLAANGVDGTTVDVGRLARDHGGQPGAAAHVLGRTPTELEQSLIDASTQPLALLLASPAFQFH